MTTHFLDWHAIPPEECRHGAITIGNFDGAHLGHRALLEEAMRQAERIGGPAVAVTLDPHPITLLRPDFKLPLLTTLEQRCELLRAIGIEHILVLRTSESFLRHTAEEFFRDIVVNNLDAQALVEGINFGFGRDRAGNIETLKELCQESGRHLSVVQPVLVEGEPVSSSRIRGALEEGNVAEAARLLGRPYRILGRVEEGEKRGRTLGFPTANLGAVRTVLPAEGVYAVRAHLEDGSAWPAAANIGPNPTFGVDARKIEVHLINFEGDLYGREMAVDIVEPLRPVRPFAGIEELKQQLRQDLRQAERMLEDSSE